MKKPTLNQWLLTCLSVTALLCSIPVRAADLSSPFPSCVNGTEIPNSHYLDSETSVMRGMAPRNAADFESLKDLGVKQILIFKNQTKSEVADEIAQLKTYGWRTNQILQIPFLWKDHGDFASACRQTVEALAWLEQARAARQKVFFHCTVGEDRTGYLAGLLRFWWDEGSVDELFETELCRNGYEAGNPQKPLKQVVMKIRASLTPLFVKMAFVLSTAESLDPEVLCQTDPATKRSFQKEWSHWQTALKCTSSPRYPLRASAAKACAL